jgi:hypothetical protein
LKAAVAFGLVALALFAGAAVAAAPSLSVTPSSVQQGHVVTVKGSAGGCATGDTVVLISRAFARTHTFAGVPAVLTKVRSNGRFLAMTRIPASKPPRTYGITVRCGGGNLGVQAHLTVTGTPSLVVLPSTVHRGYAVTLKGSADGCPVGDTVTLISHAFAHTHDFAGVPAVFATVRAGGAFRVSTTIPATKAPGRYGITARCGGGNLGVQAHLRVLT